MTFSAISEFKPDDQQGKARWLLEHWYEHIAFQQGLQALGTNLPSYPLQEIGNDQLWLLDHHLTHQAIWAALGGGVANDLSRLDWDNENMVYSWLEVHAEAHRVVRTALGL